MIKCNWYYVIDNGDIWNVVIVVIIVVCNCKGSCLCIYIVVVKGGNVKV